MTTDVLRERLISDRQRRKIEASDAYGSGLTHAVEETQRAIASAMKEAPSAANAARLEKLRARLAADQANLRVHAEAHSRLLSGVQS